MNSSFDPANMTTSVSSEPKELVFNVEGLAMTAMAGVSYCVNAVGEDFWVVVVDGGGRRNGVTSHKDLYHR